MNNGPEDLRVCHVNCQSLPAHFDEFSLFFSDLKYHIICMSETWLKPAIPDSMMRVPGYFLFRCDRVGRQGGGSWWEPLSVVGAPSRKKGAPKGDPPACPCDWRPDSGYESCSSSISAVGDTCRGTHHLGHGGVP